MTQAVMLRMVHIRNSAILGQGQWFGYTYDLDGNITKRQDLVQGLDSTLFSYDALDRVTLCTQTGANDAAFAWSHYDYDLNNNIQDTYRDANLPVPTLADIDWWIDDRVDP